MVHSFSMVHCNGSEQWFSVERRSRKKERKAAGLLGGGMVVWGDSCVERAAQRAHHAGRRLQGLVCTMDEFEVHLGHTRAHLSLIGDGALQGSTRAQIVGSGCSWAARMCPKRTLRAQLALVGSTQPRA